MKAELDRLNEREVWDFEILRHEGTTLVIAGSNDFTYYHNVEIEFREVTFCDVPEAFSHAEFLVSASDERVVWVFAESREYQIHASSVSVRWGTVYYYDRENLQPGDRIAPWVRTRE